MFTDGSKINFHLIWLLMCKVAATNTNELVPLYTKMKTCIQNIKCELTTANLSYYLRWLKSNIVKTCVQNQSWFSCKYDFSYRYLISFDLFMFVKYIFDLTP